MKNSLTILEKQELKLIFFSFNPLAAGRIDLRWLQFAQKIVQMVFLT